MVDRLPGGFPARRFLAEYWQKKPLLIRAAVPDTGTLPGRAELFSLARNPDIESRLVLEQGGEHPWQVLHGPFSRAALARLPATRWSLLVQGVNFHVAAVAALLDRFAFIPNWRVDDAMFSVAPDQGSVGPHLDSYDVFLLQMAGRRRWRISSRRHRERDFVSGLDLRILKNFRATREWILEPGDMLYLPPGIAHHGTAVGDSITCSVGFRTPSNNELLGALADTPPATEQRLADPGLAPQRDAGEITLPQLRRLRTLLQDAMPRGRGLDHWLGRQLTQLPPSVPEPARARKPAVASLAARLTRGDRLVRAPAVRCAFLRTPSGGATLFVNGTAYPTSARLAACITGPGPLAAPRGRAGWSPRAMRLLCELVRAGALLWHA